MSTLTLMRLYLKYQSMPRLPLPCLGYAGTIYCSPLINQQRWSIRDHAGQATSHSELAGTSKILVKNGAIGSYFYRRYSTTTDDIKKAEKERQDKNKFKLRTQQTIKIMVVTDTGSISAMTLEEATKLAKKRNLNLIHITNPKDKPLRTEKEVYKLTSKLASIDEDEEGEEFHEQGDIDIEHEGPAKFGKDKNNDKKQQEVKTVLMKSNTGEHDVNSKVNKMKKWIQKGHRIRVQISQSGDKGSAESIFQNIEAQMSEVEGQIQQKITKNNELRFYVGPPKLIANAKPKKPSSENKEKSSKNNDDSDSDDDHDQEQFRAGRTARRS